MLPVIAIFGGIPFAIGPGLIFATSFANPAITIARCLSDSFAGTPKRLSSKRDFHRLLAER